MTAYHNYSDTDLVVLLKNSDEIAFEEIYKRYAVVLFRYAYHNLSSREECHEAVQDVFESLWARRENQEIVTLKAYLYNSVRYRIIRHFRRDRLRHQYAEHYLHFEAAHSSLPEEERTPETIQALILKNLEGLAERAQEAFKLRVTENLSNSEIAERMHISKSTVELYMVKAFNHLREIGQPKLLDEQG
jgi:RNA polymerase sigma-70 factor (family 1)